MLASKPSLLALAQPAKQMAEQSRRLRKGLFFSASNRKSDLPRPSSAGRLRIGTFDGWSPLARKVPVWVLGKKGIWHTIPGVVKQIRESCVLDEAKATIYRVNEQCDQIGDGGPSRYLVDRQVSLPLKARRCYAHSLCSPCCSHHWDLHQRDRRTHGVRRDDLLGAYPQRHGR